MIGNKERVAGSAIAALRLSQCMFKALIEHRAITKDAAVAILIHAAAESEQSKYAWHILAEMRDWLDKQPDG